MLLLFNMHNAQDIYDCTISSMASSTLKFWNPYDLQGEAYIGPLGHGIFTHLTTFLSTLCRNKPVMYHSLIH